MKLTKVPLSEAVDALRSELTGSLQKKPGEGIAFNIQSVELELQVVAEASSSGKLSGGWSLLGWKLGGEAEATDSQSGVHKVKMHLEPVTIDKNGNSSKLAIGRKDPDQY